MRCVVGASDPCVDDPVPTYCDGTGAPGSNFTDLYEKFRAPPAAASRGSFISVESSADIVRC
jgi:hypothetical protein